MMDRSWKPNVEASPNCPRCGSSNTKFCYYNNYSLTQPRYFCKGCRRYWTKGGSLRNVPVGGGCRKNRKGNKSFRQSNEGLPSMNLSCTGIARDPIIGNSSLELLSSSSVSDGSNIDLALVYANFLNQKPNSETGFEKSQPCTDFNHNSIEGSHASLSNTYIGPSITLPEEAGLVDCMPLQEQGRESHLRANDHTSFCGHSSIQKQQDRSIEQVICHEATNFELPPLPVEETASQDLMWSNSDTMTDHDLQGSQPPVLAPAAQDPDILLGNWSPFDLSSDDMFSKP